MSIADTAVPGSPKSVAQFPSPPATDDQIGRAALRKASLRLLPLIGIGYGIAFIDRANVSFAALQMNRDLGFSASAYGLGAGLFFLSYAALEVPSNLLLVRFGARRWLSRIMLTWGLISICMMFVKTPAQFYLTRLALGAAEAGFFPGIIFYLSRWFPPGERSKAISRFYIAIPLSSVVSGSLAGMLLGLQGKLGLAGWQWLFLLEGVPAVLLSAVFMKCLPDDVETATWLDEQERAWISRKLQKEAQELGIHQDGRDVVRALREPRVWMMGIFLFLIYAGAYAYTFTAPLIVRNMTGLNATKVGVIIAIFGILGAAAMLLGGWHSDRAREQRLHILIPLLVEAACCVMAGVSNHPAIVVPSLGLMFITFCAYQSVAWSLPPGFLSGKSAAVGIAAINMMSICGGFIGPWWMGLAAGKAERYQRGLLPLAVPILIAAVLMVLILRYSERLARARRASPVVNHTV